MRISAYPQHGHTTMQVVMERAEKELLQRHFSADKFIVHHLGPGRASIVPDPNGRVIFPQKRRGQHLGRFKLAQVSGVAVRERPPHFGATDATYAMDATGVFLQYTPVPIDERRSSGARKGSAKRRRAARSAPAHAAMVSQVPPRRASATPADLSSLKEAIALVNRAKEELGDSLVIRIINGRIEAVARL